MEKVETRYKHLLFKKRTGEGQSTCSICKTRTWDSFCYSVYVNSNLEPVQYNYFICCNDCKQFFKGGIKSE